MPPYLSQPEGVENDASIKPPNLSLASSELNVLTVCMPVVTTQWSLTVI